MIDSCSSNTAIRSNQKLKIYSKYYNIFNTLSLMNKLIRQLMKHLSFPYVISPRLVSIIIEISFKSLLNLLLPNSFDYSKFPCKPKAILATNSHVVSAFFRQKKWTWSFAEILQFFFDKLLFFIKDFIQFYISHISNLHTYICNLKFKLLN